MRMRILGTVMLAVGLLATALAAAPVISVDADTYDFGSVLEGTLVTHRFVITNAGTSPLEDLRAVSKCGCTTSSLSTTKLAPGASAEVEVTFNTSGYGGKTVTKSVSVESNDPKKPALSLHLTGKVTRLAAYNIAVTDLRSLVYILVDARSAEAYAQSHIIGAVNIPYEQFAATVALLPSGTLIVVYDADGTKGDEIAKMLIQKGHLDAKSLVGGFAMWVARMGKGFLWPLGQ
jgi:rhodanese-related sulfurtransferase